MYAAWGERRSMTSSYFQTLTSSVRGKDFWDNNFWIVRIYIVSNARYFFRYVSCIILYVIKKDFVEMHFTTPNLYSSSAGDYKCLGRVQFFMHWGLMQEPIGQLAILKSQWFKLLTSLQCWFKSSASPQWWFKLLDSTWWWCELLDPIPSEINC